MSKKIGVDIDGVICDFNQSYCMKFVEVTGRNLWPESWIIAENIHPPVWDYELHFGYTKEERSRVWNIIKEDEWFWMRLDCYEDDLMALRNFTWRKNNNKKNDIYFVTSRPGKWVKYQTECWLEQYGFYNPTVILSDNKGAIAQGIGLDCFIDDKLENILSIQHFSPNTNVYLIDKLYNKDRRNEKMKIVNSVKEFLVAEELISA